MSKITLELTRDEFDCLYAAVDYFVVDLIDGEWDGYYEPEEAEEVEQKFNSLHDKIIEVKENQ